MVFWRRFVASGFITFFTLGCGDGAKSSIENTKQVIQEINVAQLLTEAQASQKAEHLFRQGNNFLDAKRYQDAVEAYDQAIAIKPESADTWVNRGNALTSLKQYKDALASYDKAIAIQPDQHEAWYNRANALTSLKQYKEALASYDKAIAIQPNKHEAYYNKACSYALQQNVELAIENLQKAIQLAPGTYQALVKTDSDLDKLRGDKRFQELIQQTARETR